MTRFLQLPHGMSVTFLASFLTSGLASISLLVVALILTPTDVADVRVLQAIIAIGLVISGMGYTTGLLKVCAESSSPTVRESYLRKVGRHTTIASLMYLPLVLLGASIGALGARYEEIRPALLLALACVPLAVATENFRNFLYAERRFGDAARAQIAVRLASFVATIAATKFFGLNGFLLGTLASHFLGAAMFSREITNSYRRAAPINFPSYFARFSSFAMLGNLFVILANYGDMILLSMMSSDRNALGAYALASACLGGLMIVTTSFQTVLLPDMIDMRKGKNWLRANFVHQQLRLGVLSLVAAALASGIVAILFPALYRSSFQMTPSLFFGLCISYFLVSLGTLAGTVFMGLGRTSVNTLVAGIALLAAFFIAFWAIRENGVWGMVAGKITYGLTICLLGNFLVWRELKSEIDKA
jgi:O-antigen/teichoic acid export membrane protein